MLEKILWFVQGSRLQAPHDCPWFAGILFEISNLGGNKTLFRGSFRASALLLFLVCNLSIPAFSQPLPSELPTGEAIQAGNISVNQIGNSLNVNSLSDKSIVDWQTFSIICR